MSFSPRPCMHCGGVTFHVLPGLQLEAWKAVTVLGMAASSKLGANARWTVTVVVCTQCGRTDTFTANAAQLAEHLPGSHVVNAAR